MWLNSKIRSTKQYLVFSCLFFVLANPAAANSEKSSFNLSTGLEIKIIKDKSMDFVYAELLISYRDKKINPVIPHLTMLDVFDKDVNRSGTNLLSTLKKLGNDFEIEHRPDYLLFKINFLSDRMRVFAQFLKSLYTYKAFTLKKLNYSISNYWKLLPDRKDWQKQAAIQVAYSKFFSGQLLGNALIVPAMLKNINLAQLRSFYQKTYTLPNSLLIIKGNLEPGYVVGTINRALKSFKKKERKRYVKEALKINGRREVIIYNVNTGKPPLIFWFEAIPPLSHPDHIPQRVLNDMLFARHVGRLSRSVRNGVRISQLETEIYHHRGVSLICNCIKLNYKDIPGFIGAVDFEKRRLKKISRKDYLEAKNHFYGSLKVATRKVENDVILERDSSLFRPDEENRSVSFARISQQLTLERLNTAAPDFVQGTIVILGNAGLIARYLTGLKFRITGYIR
ncbi:MAG: insulinase family protein [Candidatus Aminicenantes bacterium]|nr:insulinase family protein [Candidatus Aminicenantes bacterium]